MPRILVIDDDRAVGTAVKVLLEFEGMDVVYVEDGQSGVDLAKSSEFDAAIVDIFMPGLDGLETIKALHQIRPALPIVAISGFMFRNGHTRAPDFLEQAIHSGATCSLAKPIRPRDLRAALESCLGLKSSPESTERTDRDGSASRA